MSRSDARIVTSSQTPARRLTDRLLTISSKLAALGWTGDAQTVREAAEQLLRAGALVDEAAKLLRPTITAEWDDGEATAAGLAAWASGNRRQPAIPMAGCGRCGGPVHVSAVSGSACRDPKCGWREQL